MLAVRFVVGKLAMDPLRHALVDYKAHNLSNANKASKLK